MENKLRNAVFEGFRQIFGAAPPDESITFQRTRKDFEGDITLVVFPLLRWSRKKPEETASLIGEYLQKNLPEVSGYKVIKGFLNLVISDEYWKNELENAFSAQFFGPGIKDTSKIVIEYSSPNTNKPLHLGHIRNNLLGYSLANLLKANGHEVVKVNLINDRGIHICKSMLAWQKWGRGESPESSGMKGDHFIGKYYVLFDRHFREEAASLKSQGMSDDEIMQHSPLMKEAREMLKRWEDGDEEVRNLWAKMNDWAYKGFDETYRRMGVDFDKVYYESDTYKLGKELVYEGIEKGVFTRKADNSVWADLSENELDEKLLLRADGTSVYMTQDLGTAQLRYDDFQPDELVYVVGNEQNYHFQVLSLLLEKLGRRWSGSIRHFSYGMVELPEGKMKSREGTVVDADDLMDEMVETAKAMATEYGKADDLDEEHARRLYEMIGMAALKYFILKVDPKKQMLFNPEESVDFNGNTGPFIQYTYARIRSVFRKADERGVKAGIPQGYELLPKEKQLLKQSLYYPEILQEAGYAFSPALLANYLYELAREYNQFYQEIHILNADSPDEKQIRLSISDLVARIIKHGMQILGIEVPEKM